MSHLKPYPKYKPSGVEWLDDVPEHWGVKRLKFLARLNPTKSEVSLLPSDTQVQFLPMESVNEDGSYSLNEVRKLSDVYTGYTYCRDQDVIMAKITPCFENGKGAILKRLANGIGFGSTEFHVLRHEHGVPEFIWYVTKTIPFRQLGQMEMKGAVGQQRVPDSFIANFYLAAPDKAEQSAIATFLDRETTRIDALVEKKQRFIKLLKEKRQALITDAVTGKFDVSIGKPYPAYKPSGVEWLGDVPEHWVTLPFKRLATIQNGRDYKHVEVKEGGYPVIGSGGAFALASEHLFSGESVLLGRKGTIDKPLYIDGAFWPVDTMFYTKIDDKADAKFVYYTALTIPFNLYSTNTALPSMTQEDLSSNPVAAPDRDEQSAIAAFLDRETKRVDALEEKTEKSIELLKERRSALITAAVTGKIDVREAE